MFLQTYIFYRKIMQKANVIIILILNGFNRESYEEIKMRQKNSFIILSDQGFFYFSSNEWHVVVVRITYSYFNVF